jgi:exopolyphosphatase / guanosine-5'-triphosphate,3'-diphosphate pyrophosphatase
VTRRVGAVDCGTNSIRLLVADVGDDGLLTDVERRTEVVRLGQGIDRTGVIAPEAMERTLAMSREYADRCRELGTEAVRFVATSASRDARNADEFVAGVREAFGDLDVAPEVVAGDVEARLSFTGATGDLRRLGVPGPYLVVDLGGGSTELVRGTDDVEAGRSLDIGCVRMTERHLAGDPPTDDEVVSARADVALALDSADVDLAGLGAVVGLAGSITTVTAHALGLGRYDREAIHLAEVALDAHRLACRELLGMSRDERAALPYMHPGRVDVIGAGALVWHEVLGRVALRSPGVRVVTSEHDILDGIALSVAGGP